MSERQDKPPTAVLYLREARSSKGYGLSAIDAQRHLCEQRANELGLTVVREYVDHGAAYNIDRRPGLREMLGDLKLARDIDFVITYDPARISRDAVMYLYVVWAIQDAGAELEIASTTHVDVNSAISQHMRDISARQHTAGREPQPGTHKQQPSPGAANEPLNEQTEDQRHD
jgi:DNA invertase Pin-like site-specific DNA recombinase